MSLYSLLFDRINFGQCVNKLRNAEHKCNINVLNFLMFEC
jgi:hypothetical protein